MLNPSPLPVENGEILEGSGFRRLWRQAASALSASLGIPLLVLFALVLVLLRSADKVDHSDRVVAEATRVKEILLSIQTNFRAYRLSDDGTYLTKLSNERATFAPELATLSKCVSDNPRQVSRVEELRGQANAWLGFMDAELAAVRRDPGLVRAPSILKYGSPLFDAGQATLDAIIDEDQRLRGDRDQFLKRVVAVTLMVLGVAAIAGIPLLMVWLKAVLGRVSGSYESATRAAELRARELQVTLSSIGDAVLATDARGRVSFLNPRAEALTGWSNEEACGRELTEVFDIFNEQTRLPAPDPVQQVLLENVVVGLANHTVLRSRSGGEAAIEDSAAPIRNDRGEVVGVILVFRDVSERCAVERIRNEDERRFHFLSDLGEATRRLAAPAEILAATTRLLGEHLRVSRCAYAEVEDDGDRFTILNDYTDGCASAAGAYRLSDFDPGSARELRAGNTLIVRDVDSEIAPGAERDHYGALAIKATISCALLKEGRLRAMMAVHQTEPRDWVASEIELVEEVVERSWATIERARAEEELRERARLSSFRADIAGKLASSASLDETLQACCQFLVNHLDVAFARIWTLDSAENVLVLIASAGLYTHRDGPHARVPVGSFKIGRIAQNRQPHLTNDVRNDPNVSDPEWARREAMTAFAGYPLIVEGQVNGVLAFFSRHRISEAAVGDLAPVADAIAQHIERRRAEAALKSSENLKTAILEASLDGFILMNHEGRIVDWNPAAEEMFGAKRAETAGKLLGETIVPERLREAHQKGLARYLATGESRILGRRYELPALRSDGTEFPAEISITHIPRTGPPLFAGYVRDITERRENELALKTATGRAEAAALAVAESAERFRLLSEVVSIQVWTARANGELDFANAECGDYFGVEVRPEILGHAWAQFVHPDDLPAALAVWQECLATGKPYEVEFRLRRADGNYRWFLVRGEAMRDAEGAIVKWFGTNTDIDDLKVAQSQAERASRAKDNFLAALSHELRTPLTPVLLAAAALREDERLPPEVRVQLGMMERNIGLEARLIDDLLDLTRIAKGKLPLRPQLCDAHSLISLAIDIVHEEARTKNIRIEPQFTAKRSGLTADPSRFQQVIWNLLRNAVKFTPGGGNITITTRDCDAEAGGERLSIEVRDSGIGIEAEAIERIFEPFEQAELGGDHRFGGVGLGLAIARAIVDLHGGTIRAQSEGVGHGAVFIAEWPGATEPPHGIADPSGTADVILPGPAADETGSPAFSLRLLLVEDNEPTLQVLTRLLTRSGHQVVPAATVADALAAAATQSFDGVISDLGLPDGTGNDLMQQLRQRHNLRGIALTGYGMEEDMERSLKAGFVMHIIKPVDVTQLRRALSMFKPESA
jgi:PAS domain S-box-containing protein